MRKNGFEKKKNRKAGLDSYVNVQGTIQDNRFEIEEAELISQDRVREDRDPVKKLLSLKFLKINFMLVSSFSYDIRVL